MEQVKPIDYSCHLQLKESTTYRFASLFLFSLFYKAYTIFSRHPCLVKRMTFSVKRKIWRYPVKLLVPSPKRDRPPHWGLHPLLIKNGYLFKACETGPRVYCMYPRRLESLMVCRCHYKGSTFSSVIRTPWVLVRLGFEPVGFCSAD